MKEMNLPLAKKLENQYGVLICVVPCVQLILMRMNIKRAQITEKKWAESEYIKKAVISKKDRAFLEYLEEEYKYIARDKNDALYAYNAEACKVRESWSSGCSDDWFRLNHRFDVNFPMVKCEGNEEIWLIEDLKKLEVVEEYEENSR